MDETVWVDLMTLRALQPGEEKQQEMRLATVKLDDVAAMIEFWSPAIPDNEIWTRPSTRNGA